MWVFLLLMDMIKGLVILVQRYGFFFIVVDYLGLIVGFFLVGWVLVFWVVVVYGCLFVVGEWGGGWLVGVDGW